MNKDGPGLLILVITLVEEIWTVYLSRPQTQDTDAGSVQIQRCLFLKTAIRQVEDLRTEQTEKALKHLSTLLNK